MPSELPPLSSGWDAPAADLGGADVACRWLDTRLPADGALWGPAWARRVLSRAERERFEALDRPEHRRLEWLGARTAAKEAVVDLVRARHNLALLPADVELVADERGRPEVRIAGLERLDPMPVVSLAHAQGLAIAVAALVPAGSGRAVGIDLEPVRELPAGFAEASLTPEERRLLDGIAEADAGEWLLRCWCAKEAAGKAAGTGVGSGDERPTVLAVDRATQAVTVAAGGRPLTVATRRENDLIITTTTWPDQGGPA